MHFNKPYLLLIFWIEIQIKRGRIILMCCPAITQTIEIKYWFCLIVRRDSDINLII